MHLARECLFPLWHHIRLMSTSAAMTFLMETLNSVGHFRALQWWTEYDALFQKKRRKERKPHKTIITLLKLSHVSVTCSKIVTFPDFNEVSSWKRRGAVPASACRHHARLSVCLIETLIASSVRRWSTKHISVVRSNMSTPRRATVCRVYVGG